MVPKLYLILSEYICWRERERARRDGEERREKKRNLAIEMVRRWLEAAGRIKEAAVGAGLRTRPWSTTQLRHLKVNAIHLRTGNVIEKSGRIYQVVEAEHRQRGRGGASMTLELRDVDSGSKTSLRFGPEEAVERVFVEEKPFTCLYKEQDTAYLMDTQKFEQLEVPLAVFGKSAAYLKEDLKVKLSIYDGRPLSGSVPKQVTCSIIEKQELLSGTVNPRSVKAVLDNGLSIQVPPYLAIGDEIIVNTEDDSYVSRA